MIYILKVFASYSSVDKLKRIDLAECFIRYSHIWGHNHIW